MSLDEAQPVQKWNGVHSATSMHVSASPAQAAHAATDATAAATQAGLAVIVPKSHFIGTLILPDTTASRTAKHMICRMSDKGHTPALLFPV